MMQEMTETGASQAYSLLTRTWIASMADGVTGDGELHHDVRGDSLHRAKFSF